MVPGQPFHSLCSAVVSWRNFRNTGLRAEIGQVRAHCFGLPLA